MSDSNFAVDLDLNSATMQHAVGTEYTEPAGYVSQDVASAVRHSTTAQPRTWRYVGVAAGTVFPVGTVLARPAGSVALTGLVIAPINCTPQRVAGVVQSTLGHATEVRYGWIVKEGQCEVIADTGGVTADRPIKVGNGAAGAVDDSGGATTSDAAAFGFTHDTAAATALATCTIKCL